MNPSDEQLRLAIAEIIAKENSWIIEYSEEFLCKAFKAKRYPENFRVIRIPNYPGDTAAAMGLPLETNDEKRRFAIELAKIVIPDVNIGIAAIVYEAAFATARQRCEAWLNARSKE